ncbi:MAG: GNAT family N-acetyltransferase [Rhodospirillaceae bacterium]|nr:GNAT family N-acetyltransferase [Rhodospirillaceae bacterium]
MSIPTLMTAHLVLRGFREDDLDAVAEMYADNDYARFITPDGKPYTRAISWRTLCGFAGHWALRGYGFWGVEEKASRKLIGSVGCHFPEGWPAKEVGWSIHKAHWGKGYATEAARAALHYAANTLRWPHAIHVINPANVRSAAVAAKLGSVREDVWLRDGVELHLYGQDLKPD